MSQDLLAAFGPPPSTTATPGHAAQDAPTNAPSSFSFFDDFNTGNTVASSYPQRTNALSTAVSSNRGNYRDDATVQENEDDWGDFEGGLPEEPEPKQKAPAKAPAPAPVPIASQFSRWLDEEDDGFPDYEERNAKTRKGGAKWDFTKPKPPAQPVPPKQTDVKQQAVEQSATRDPNVLFDAEDEQLDEDDFGDFEGADEGAEQLKSVDAPSSGFGDLLGMDSFTSPSVVQQSTSKATIPSSLPATGGSLLDLEDLTIHDESTNAWKSDDSQPPVHGFGTLGPVSSKAPVPIVMSNTMYNPSTSAIRGEQNPASPTSTKKQSLSKRSPSKKSPTKQGPVKQILKPVEDEETWDDFEAWEQGPDPVEPKSLIPSSAAIPSIPPALTSDTADSSLSSPPTNIPPPTLVLSLFPTLFLSAETSFFRPLRQELTEVQNAIYHAPAATTYLKGMLAIGTVCGRVIAGRKHRWKRDTILAQSMRIGPSAAGGVSGLKLTSIDKAENAKEEREVADVLKAWQAQVGKLKSALAEVKKVTGKDVGKIPELRDTIPIKVAKEIEGGLKGNRSCALCGLKREERVLKVDFEVEDSFGEWWVEDVSMHRACRNFWEQHRESLRYK